MKKELKEVLDFYKKDTEKGLKFLEEINYQYGDKKYIQRIKNHKLILDYIEELEEKIKKMKATD